MTWAWDKEKSESQTGIEPLTSQTPGGRSIHSAKRTHEEHWVHMWQVSCILLGSALPNSSWVVISPPGVQEVMGSIPVGDSDFSLSHARVILNISSFTSNYRAQNSPSSFTYHNFVYLLIFWCHGQRHFKAKIRFEWEQKFVANYNKHHWTLHTIHARKSEWKGSRMRWTAKLYNLFKTE